MYENILKFKGNWRTYQARVLSRFDEYKKDKRVHIVAAPGSGKTTLGIELIRLLDKPCIILAPTITIRKQWVERIEEAFLLEGINSEDIISQNLRDMRLITVSTYQAIHSAMTHYKGILLDDGEDTSKKELVDYEMFDLILAIKENNIQTICLDECHHLRNEWWKSLEKFKKETSLEYTIALTATPPYDSSFDLWERYIKVCGDIDEEITVPELVKDSNLCPHQDYVYFNYPTKDELDRINEFKRVRDEYCDLLLKDETFKRIVSSHPFLKDDVSYDLLLENPAYLSSILIYLNAVGRTDFSNFKKILGYVKLEKPSPKWFEVLLQGVLYDDITSYNIPQDILEKYQHDLKVRGLVEKKKVCLLLNSKLKKSLVRSIGKCESIKNITFNEYNSMGDDLRLLILCDYIKKEYKSEIGNEQNDTPALGVIPFFELLRKEAKNQNSSLKLGVLCGSIVFIPPTAKSRLLELVENPSSISFKEIGNLSSDEYVEVDIKGERHFLTSVVTNLFEEGYINALIGTKSLLGEGWDSPCVNSLILASFVGSFMLSNQMRGRAIRTYHKNPNKVSNIWHLVCVLPPKIQQSDLNFITDDYNENEDIETLIRRMDNFLGLHYTLDTIETGIGRLTAIEQPITKKRNVYKTNEKMLKLSSNRDNLKARWDKSLAILSDMEVVEEVCKENKPVTVVLLFDYIRYIIVFIIISMARLTTVPLNSIDDPTFVTVLILFICIIGIIGMCIKIILCINPLKSLQKIGEGVRMALLNINQFNSENHRVETVHEEFINAIYLVGGSGHDKAIFAKCMKEMFSDIDNQRYILYAPRLKRKSYGYYPIPDIFSKRKEDAEAFASIMKKYIGSYKVVYTRSPKGRLILLKGRKYAWTNRQNRIISKKKVKGALE